MERPSPVAKTKRLAKRPAQPQKPAVARAKKAARPVDQQHEAGARGGAVKNATKRKAATPKRAAPKSVPRKSAAKSGAGRTATKDPKGGLTAAGRKAFAARDGSHLKPGVKKPESEMSTTEMRRKGSWAARFFGRSKLPPLVDEDGQPTRFALSAAAWGEPVPKTHAAARAIAAKGHKLLERARARA